VLQGQTRGAAQLKPFQVDWPSWAANFASISAKWLTYGSACKRKFDALLAEPEQSSYAILALRQQLSQHSGKVPIISIARDSVAFDFNDGHPSYHKWLSCPAEPWG
jgi:hypothetical protein